jgi:hypothetical protein
VLEFNKKPGLWENTRARGLYLMTSFWGGVRENLKENGRKRRKVKEYNVWNV